MFRNTGANAFAKNQMRLAYEDKRDLYCNCVTCKNVMSRRVVMTVHEVMYDIRYPRQEEAL